MTQDKPDHIALITFENIKPIASLVEPLFGFQHQKIMLSEGVRMQVMNSTATSSREIH